ncbi:MAG: AAA family ATPase, partial [Actinomycetota bacterium]|nr:AAA family ATPase [Actinomycetota bacterium]
EAELDFVRDALARATSTRCVQLVTLVGVPGIGKSRLVAELRAESETLPDTVVWRRGRALPYGDGVMFSVLAEITKVEAGIFETDSASRAAVKLAESVRRAVPDPVEARWIEGHLRPLVGIAAEPEAGPGTSAEAFAAWRRFFEALAEDATRVLVVEDLHWADDSFLDFLDYLVEWAADVPLLVLATARPELLERRPAWGGGKRNAATLSLPPLSDAEIASLVGTALERSRLEADALGGLLRRAGGNPLYAEEYARMVREEGEPGALPSSVHGIIAARIDALTREEKRLLQAAAVVGQSFWVSALVALASFSTATVEELLHSLERKEFVRRERRSAVSRDQQMSFAHVLVRDVAYTQIPRAARGEMHERAAEWIESLSADRPEDHAELLAHHYLAAIEYTAAAEEPRKELARAARRALRDAGDRAASLSAFGAAARYYRSALDLTPEDDPHFPELLLRSGTALFHCEDAGRDELARALDLLAASDEPAKAAEAEVMLAWFDRREGRAPEGDRRLRHARELVRGAPPSSAKAAVLARLAGYLMVEEDFDEARAVAAEALDLAERLSLDDLRAHVLATRGVVRTTLGDLDGLADLERAIEVANEAGVPEGAIRGYNNLSSVVANMGDLARSLELAEEGNEKARRFGLAAQIRWASAQEMQHSYWLGDWREAARLADEAISAGADSRYYWEPVARVVRGQLRLASGDVGGACADALEGLEFARAIGDPQILFASLAFAARAFAESGETERGSVLAAELFDAWRPTGVVYWLPDLAVVSEAVGESEAFADAVSTVRLPSKWVEAGLAFVAGAYGRAADVYGDIGSRPEEAYARLRSALHARARSEGSAEHDRARALAFFRSVGADGYAAQAESALTAPTSSP